MAEGSDVVYVFIGLVTLANEEDICDMGVAALARRINMTLERVEHAIERLCMPDPESKLTAHEGRRIISLQDFDEIESNRGWFVVNRQHYIEQSKKENRQKTNARYYSKRKAEGKTGKVLKSGDSDDVKTHIDVDIDLNINKKQKTSQRIFSDDDLSLAENIFSSIQELNPNHKQPNLENWADDIRLMRERDNHTHEEIKNLFIFANNHDFWKGGL